MTAVRAIRTVLEEYGYEVNPKGFDLARQQLFPVILVYGTKDREKDNAPANFSECSRDIVMEIISGERDEFSAEEELESHRRRIKQIFYRRENIRGPITQIKATRGRHYVTNSMKTPRGLFLYWDVVTRDELSAIEEMPS